MKASSAGIDARAARRRFERAARTYAQASRLEQEAGARMLERLDFLKLAPRRILDAGSGPSPQAAALAKRYRGATLVAVDFSLGMLRTGAAGRYFWQKPLAHAVCADLAQLPLASGSVDLAWCNMALHWMREPNAALKELARVLAPEGLLMLSTLGPDSLKELRVAAGAARVHEFADMHDLGDLLLAAGLSAPVMEMEMLSVRYPGTESLLDDLRKGGQTSARADRARGLSGKGFGRALRAGLAREPGVELAATYELVFGHAWKAGGRREAGRDIVQFHPRSLR